MTVQMLICFRCKHLKDTPPVGKDYGLACAAFTGGIPLSIIESNKHDLPVDGDNGIRFELKEEEV
jgi:hypothetical protein